MEFMSGSRPGIRRRARLRVAPLPLHDCVDTVGHASHSNEPPPLGGQVLFPHIKDPAADLPSLPCVPLGYILDRWMRGAGGECGWERLRAGKPSLMPPRRCRHSSLLPPLLGHDTHTDVCCCSR